MGYFDGLTDATFKEDDKGRSLFFPFGVLAKGRIIPDEKTKLRLRTFVKRYYQISLPAMVVIGVCVSWLWAFAIIIFSLIPFYLILYQMISDFEVAGISLTFSESCRNSARSHNKFILWLLFISSIVFVVLGGVIVIADPQNIIIGILSIVFFGLCAFGIGYMIKAKDN